MPCLKSICIAIIVTECLCSVLEKDRVVQTHTVPGSSSVSTFLHLVLLIVIVAVTAYRQLLVVVGEDVNRAIVVIVETETTTTRWSSLSY